MVDGSTPRVPSSRFLHRMFAHPSGFLGHLGGWIMGLSNQDIAQWTLEALDVQPGDRVLEIGFGPGEEQSISLHRPFRISSFTGSTPPVSW